MTLAQIEAREYTAVLRVGVDKLRQGVGVSTEYAAVMLTADLRGIACWGVIVWVLPRRLGALQNNMSTESMEKRMQSLMSINSDNRLCILVSVLIH